MYEEKYVRRGEIYSVKSGEYDEAAGSMSRPGLIVSNTYLNDAANTVIVVFLTTNDNNIGIHYGPIMNTGRPSYVCCERIMSVSKARLGKLMGSLSENQMQEVENRLDEVLDLGYIDNGPLKKKEQEIDALKLQMEELKSKVSMLKTSLDEKEDEILTRDVEIAVHKRMYEKAVGIIAAMKAEPDLPKPPRLEKKPEVSEEPKKPEPPKPVEPNLMDINSATFSQLRGIGLSNNLVLAIINSRPHQKIEDLKKISGLNNKVYGLIEKKICCIPVTVDESPVDVVATKLNINTATVEDFVRIGFGKYTAERIVKHRNNHGDFEKVDDLRQISRVGEGSMKKLGHLLEV